MATFTTTAAGASADYVRYLFGDVTKTDRTQSGTFLDFTLVPVDASFVKLHRGNYVTLNSTTYPKWFTGYITNEPELTFLGTNNGAGVWGYIYQASSDDIILNQKPIGLVPPFLNSTQGAILAYLANLLCPGKFNTTNVLTGLTLARYVIDPRAKFADVVRDFCETAQFRFRANDLKLYFSAQDSTGCGITVDGNSKHFSPSRLTLRPSSDPIINEAVVLGDLEPQGYINEYFYGDGFTGAFPLLSSVYGVDRSIFLTDDFSNSNIDQSKWTVYDNVTNYMKVSGGYLNCVGGSNNASYDVSIQSTNLIPLDGTLRFTHGEWDFVSASDGVVAGLWTGQPNSTYTGCVYGVRCAKVSTATTLNPIAGGTSDTSQIFTVDYTKRYVMRTIMHTVGSVIRAAQKYNYINSAGAVSSYAPAGSANNLQFITYLVEINPATGAITNTYTWSNTVAANNTTLNALYIPIASNDLHCTVTGITVSRPMLVQLEIKPSGGSFTTKLVGPNELDSLDGQAPAATIVDANSGVTTRSTTLGSPQYNPGNATLYFFKDSTKQTSTTPQVGDLIHVSYRRPGISAARVRDSVAVSTEATAWGDNGVRSVVVSDLSPVPRNSLECEAAAAALVGDNAYQHYEGTYTHYSPYFTSEPLAGLILPFANLPASFPSISYEEITEVVSTFDSTKLNEIFTHNITFGRPDTVSRLLKKFVKQRDVYAPQDTAEMPNYIPPGQVGTAFCADVVAPTLTSLSSTNVTCNTNQAPPTGGGFEVRYTDDQWGADDGKNLIVRQTAQSFNVPRNARGRVCFIKAYDIRNLGLYSEDLTQWIKYGSPLPTVTSALEVNPDNELSMIQTITVASAQANGIFQTTSTKASGITATFTISVKGTVGQVLRLGIADTSGTNGGANGNVTFNGSWQRVSVTATFATNAGAGNIEPLLRANTGITFKATRGSVELGSAETVYCKTNGIVYGALSRYPAGIRVNFPLIPPAPTASLIYAPDPTAVTIRVVMPGTMQDVWGYEVRRSDNTTVVKKQDLALSGIALSYDVVDPTANATRSLSYYVYTYNLLGEYSTGYNVTATIPTPSVSSVAVDDSTKKLSWTNSATVLNCLVQISADSFSTFTFNKTVVDQFVNLEDTDFFNARYIRVTPQDTLGVGTTVAISPQPHTYQPSGFVSFATPSEIAYIPAPATSTTDPTIPAGLVDFTNDVIEASWKNRRTNYGRG